MFIIGCKFSAHRMLLMDIWQTEFSSEFGMPQYFRRTEIQRRIWRMTAAEGSDDSENSGLVVVMLKMMVVIVMLMLMLVGAVVSVVGISHSKKP